MKLERDSTAMESISLRLMIVAVIACMSIVPAAEALESLRSADFLRKADVQLSRLISTAQVLAVQGPGSVRTIELDFGGGGRARFLGLSIGDFNGGPNVSSAVLRLSNGGTMVRSAEDPVVWMATEQGQGLSIGVPSFPLMMSCVMCDESICVVVEVSQWTS